MSDTKLVFENEKARFYSTEFSKTLTDYCTMQLGNTKMPKLKGWRCLLAVNLETKSKAYVLFNDSGEPVYDTTKFDAMASHIDMVRIKAGSEKKYGQRNVRKNKRDF